MYRYLANWIVGVFFLGLFAQNVVILFDLFKLVIVDGLHLFAVIQYLVIHFVVGHFDGHWAWKNSSGDLLCVDPSAACWNGHQAKGMGVRSIQMW